MLKATAAYNFFPTESSGIAPFFLMFGCEVAVKDTLLESENPKYLGTDDGMINVGLITKLYHIVAHNLNEARKARDGNKNSCTSTQYMLKAHTLNIAENTAHKHSNRKHKPHMTGTSSHTDRELPKNKQV